MEVLVTAIIIVLIFVIGVFVGASLEDIDIEDLLSVVATGFIALIIGVLFFFLVPYILSLFL